MELAAALHRNPWTNSNGIRRRFAPESLDENYWIMQLREKQQEFKIPMQFVNMKS